MEKCLRGGILWAIVYLQYKDLQYKELPKRTNIRLAQFELLLSKRPHSGSTLWILLIA